MKKHIIILLLIALAVFFIRCSVQAPEVKITGEKTALENQIIGTYEDIEQDSWNIASVRSTSPNEVKQISEEKKKVLSAVQNRRFNKDDVNELKRDGVIGESSAGKLVIIDADKMNSDTEYKKRVEKVIADENRDRNIIIERTMQVNEQVSEADEDRVLKIFAKIFQDESEANTWIQNEDGTWMKKGQVN
ncbi:DUF1318 domain-containing protein [candidate division KSB1 bacterium]|nr:DUF1318 domain-containing protein [candidate division KSB1 bacterium]